MERFFLEVFAVYIVTCVVTSSSLFARSRKAIIAGTPWLQPTGHPHPIECRLCLGFWVSVLLCAWQGDFMTFLPVYGASYFLATQERG
jgi:hypothetical protein